MHLNKNIEKLSELNDFFTSDEKVSDTFLNMLKVFQNRSLTLTLNAIKKRGFIAGELLSVLLMLPFAGIISVRALFYSGLANISEARKDAYYRLKNMETIDWRKLLWAVARRFRELAEEKGDTTGVRCLILDDTLISKSSMHIEGMSKIFDHVSHKYLWGYKLLLLGMWDRKNFIPLCFSIHREKGRNKKKPYGMTRREKQKQRLKRAGKGTPGYIRRKELDESKAQQSQKMLRRAVKLGFMADYVLADSWFFSQKLLTCVCELVGQIHLICMAKMNSPKFKYIYQNKAYTAAELKQAKKRLVKRCRKLRAHYISCEVIYKEIPVKLYFVRYPGQEKWKLMISSDLSLSFLRVMEIYSIRWSIEVFFKEAKQHLQLGKSQSHNLDAQIADTTITMIQYTLLSLSKRFSDYETLGQLFEKQKNQFMQLTLASKIWGLILKVIGEICEVLEISPEQMLEKLMQAEKATKIEKMLSFFINSNLEDQKNRIA